MGWQLALFVGISLSLIFFPRDLQGRDKGRDNGEHLELKGQRAASSSSSEEVLNDKEGLRCYKCDPTDYNNYCRDFKPSLATPYDCNPSALEGKHSKNPSPLEVSLDPDLPFSCYKIQGDVAYGHGKVYGSKRYGCGHITKVRSTPVKTIDRECTVIKMGKEKSKDFFEGTICNCDNADGCNSASRVSFTLLDYVMVLFMTKLCGL